LKDAETRKQIMTTMGADQQIADGDFAFFFADIFVESVQYGNRVGLCDLMNTIKSAPLMDQLVALK
jgi:hypothetical protein